MKFVPAVRKRGGRRENEMLQWRCEMLSKRQEGHVGRQPAQRSLPEVSNLLKSQHGPVIRDCVEPHTVTLGYMQPAGIRLDKALQ